MIIITCIYIIISECLSWLILSNLTVNNSQTTVYWSKRIKGMPWRTAARSSQRWYVDLYLHVKRMLIY